MIITKSVNPQPIVGEYKPTTASKPSTKPVVDSYEIASKPNAFAQQNPSAAADARTAQLGAKLGAKETAAEADAPSVGGNEPVKLDDLKDLLPK